MRNDNTERQVEAGRDLVERVDFTGTFMHVQSLNWREADGIRSEYANEEKLVNVNLFLSRGNVEETGKNAPQSQG